MWLYFYKEGVVEFDNIKLKVQIQPQTHAILRP